MANVELISLDPTFVRNSTPLLCIANAYPPKVHEKMLPLFSPPNEARLMLARFTQASIVNVCSRRFGALLTDTPSPLPSITKAWPTRPRPNPLLPPSTPLLPSAASTLLPSARHQLTKPAGGVTQFVDTGTTVSRAFELIA